MITKVMTILLLVVLLTACVPPRPHDIENICSVFYQYPSWYWDARKSQQRWGVPVSVQMAVIYQESRFSAKAEPPREYLLGIIPWFRPTSAFGYTQAIRATWARYEHETGQYGKRDDFARATDFIGWYAYQAHIHARVPRDNAYAVYLAYHEGVEGYLERSYLRKPWLMRVAHRVAYRAWIYRHQLWRCANKIEKPHWWDFL